MTQQEINRLIRPYLLKQMAAQRKRQLTMVGLLAMGALLVALLLTFLFVLIYNA